METSVSFFGTGYDSECVYSDECTIFFKRQQYWGSAATDQPVWVCVACGLSELGLSTFHVRLVWQLAQSELYLTTWAMLNRSAPRTTNLVWFMEHASVRPAVPGMTQLIKLGMTDPVNGDGDPWGSNPDLLVETKDNSIGEENQHSRLDYNIQGCCALATYTPTSVVDVILCSMTTQPWGHLSCKQSKN
jgi:hypothetical protein